MSHKFIVITQDTALCFCIVLPADSLCLCRTHLRIPVQSEGAVTAELSRAAVARRHARASSEEIRLQQGFQNKT